MCSIPGFFTALLFLCALIWNSEATLRKYYVEDLCRERPSAMLDLEKHETGVLMSDSWDVTDCTIHLKPKKGSFVVLTIDNYDPGPTDRLTIEYPDGSWNSFAGDVKISERPEMFKSDHFLSIHYSRGKTPQLPGKIHFKFVFTQANKAPCEDKEVYCSKTNLCIRRDLVCDGVIPCGDRPVQTICNKEYDLRSSQETSDILWLPIILIVSAAVGILFIFISAIIICVIARNRGKATTNSINPPSTNNTTPETQTYEVPSMYPQIPHPGVPETQVQMSSTQPGVHSRPSEIPESQKQEGPSTHIQTPAPAAHLQTHAPPSHLQTHAPPSHLWTPAPTANLQTQARFTHLQAPVPFVSAESQKREAPYTYPHIPNHSGVPHSPKKQEPMEFCPSTVSDGVQSPKSEVPTMYPQIHSISSASFEPQKYEVPCMFSQMPSAPPPPEENEEEKQLEVPSVYPQIPPVSSEAPEVPSVYPHIPSSVSGEDNPGFTADA